MDTDLEMPIEKEAPGPGCAGWVVYLIPYWMALCVLVAAGALALWANVAVLNGCGG
jgi:hypothetical protein